MEEDFEQGKQCIVEGLEALQAFYEPFLKLVRGVKLLGAANVVFSDPEVAAALGKYDQLMLVLNSWLSDVRRAENKEELLLSVEKNGEFLMRFLGD